MSITLLACLPAILIGTWAAHLHGVAYSAFLPNFAAVIIGIPLSIFIRRRGSTDQDQLGIAVASIALATLACTFFAPGIEGVHRWIKIGPLFLNASMAFAPVILFGIAVAIQKGIVLPSALAILTTALHALQPDAGQAIAFTAGANFDISTQSNHDSITSTPCDWRLDLRDDSYRPSS